VPFTPPVANSWRIFDTLDSNITDSAPAWTLIFATTITVPEPYELWFETFLFSGVANDTIQIRRRIDDVQAATIISYACPFAATGTSQRAYVGQLVDGEVCKIEIIRGSGTGTAQAAANILYGYPTG